MMPVYHALPLPERESAVEIAPFVLQAAETESCFTFQSPGFAYTALKVAGTDRFVIRIDSGATFHTLTRFSQYLYEHPERNRAALIVIGGGELTKELTNAFVELFPDFPLYLPEGAPKEIREYAVERAQLKGVTLVSAAGRR